jgi:hypothetical protein
MDEGPRRDLSEGRKATYYVGNALSVLGLLLFLSVFVSFAMHFGDFSNFEGNARSGMFRAISGIVLIGAGQAIARMGRSGMAGSGVLLDPQRSRRDLEPWNRAQGGMVADALDEIPAVKNLTQSGGAPPSAAPVVKVRCRQCGTLNEEDAKFCKSCGQAL